MLSILSAEAMSVVLQPSQMAIHRPPPTHEEEEKAAAAERM